MEGTTLSIAIVSLILLVVVAVIAIPIFVMVFGQAAKRNPNRPEGDGDETERRDPNDQSGAGRD